MMEHINMCEVVQDLLPLYEDGCCSRQSRELVEAHLETCEACRRLRTAYGEQMPDTGATEEEDPRGAPDLRPLADCHMGHSRIAADSCIPCNPCPESCPGGGAYLWKSGRSVYRMQV